MARADSLILRCFVVILPTLLPPLPGDLPASPFPLDQVAELSPAAGASYLTFADTDHDGRNEVVLAWRDANFNFSYRIHEETGNNTYVEVYRGAPLIPAAIADLDQDGKSEIIGQWSADLQVFESLAPDSHPSQLVWSAILPSNTHGSTAIADTDRDGKMEIVQFAAAGAFDVNLLIFENIGDNNFTQVLSFPTHSGQPIIADLDGDGLTEIAYCGPVRISPTIRACRVTILESSANDTWAVTFTDSAGLEHGGSAEGGHDVDGNGKPDLLFSGDYFDGQTVFHRTVVYEPQCNDQFARVAVFEVADGSSGGTVNALGNLDGTGTEEYLMAGSARLYVYRPVDTGQWSLVGEVLDPSGGLHVVPHVFDLNRNGRDELIWATEAATVTTLILESPEVSPTPVEPRVTSSRIALSILPNPVRGEARLALPGLFPSTCRRLSVFDVTGRLVERRPLGPTEGGLVWQAQNVPAGTYILQVEGEGGNTLGVGRTVVIH